jgi:hypothetical protein
VSLQEGGGVGEEGGVEYHVRWSLRRVLGGDFWICLLLFRT